ncbi:hypothetical protein SVIRM249S_00606 [Streptomyces viridochromogenes]
MPKHSVRPVLPRRAAGTRPGSARAVREAVW